MADKLTDSDVGKTVVTEDGEEIGRIADVADDAAAVEPDAGLTDQLRSRLGWEGGGEDESHRIREESVSDISGDTVVVDADREQ